MITPTCFRDHKNRLCCSDLQIHQNGPLLMLYRLVPDKNFRTIAPTAFPVGVSTNWLNFYRLSLIFPSILLQIVPHFVEM